VIVDCDTCVARGPACGDCVVTSLLGLPEWWATEGVPGEEMTALAVLADSGLVPPLRLLPLVSGDASDGVGRASGRAAG
jgi:hypothetical protein